MTGDSWSIRVGSTRDPAISFLGVTKAFPGGRALDDVTFDVAAGACHALCGENGAGKSTLGNVLAGIHPPDAGRILLHGVPVRFAGPRDALAAGIGMVHQELAFCENMTVAENLCLGRLPRRRGVVDRAAMCARAEGLIAEVAGGDAPGIDVWQTIGELTPGTRQLLQVAAAVGSGARVLILDEPTSSLTEHEARHLYELVGRLRTRGVTMLYVSHRMQEIFRLCDTVTVLRDGRHVATQPTANTSEHDLVRLMAGRPRHPERSEGPPSPIPDRGVVPELRPRSLAALGMTAEGARISPAPSASSALRVSQFTSPGHFENVSFSVHAGEILGFAGLVGAGRTQVLEALFGLDPDAVGSVSIDGVAVRVRHPREAMRYGIGLVPEDRKRHGLVLSLGGRENIVLPILERLAVAGTVGAGTGRPVAERYFEQLAVRAPDVDSVTAGLSGGNQQKIVLAKWLAAASRVLLLDEPTRGVDVGAKAEIHAVIRELARTRTAIVLVSSELPELLQLADRVIVMRNGRCVIELPAQSEPDTVLRWMTGSAATAESAMPCTCSSHSLLHEGSRPCV